MNRDRSRPMDSKSWPGSFQRRGSSEQLGRRSDPGVYGSGRRRTTFKRSSEDSLEGCSKRRRTSQSPGGGFSRTASGHTSSGSYTSACSSPPDGPGGYRLPGDDGTIVGAPSSDDSWTSASTSIAGGETEERRGAKRKSDDAQGGPRKRSRKTHHLAEEPSCLYVPGAAPPSDLSGTPSSPDSVLRHSTAALEAKYVLDKYNILGEGGFGVIYAGRRKEDNLPVAIKCLPQYRVDRVTTVLDGTLQIEIPLEVALLLKLKPAAGETSAVAALLDWYDLDFELVLVLERPVPCVDLIDYLKSRRSALPEAEAKIIAKQLVDAFVEIHSKGVFHRDIKLDNILMETSCEVPRVWIIDFGCGQFLHDQAYTDEQGTNVYSSPELFLNGWYKAEPTTVWQLGVVLFGILHNRLPFTHAFHVPYEKPAISERLSSDCQDFLRRCLTKTPEGRPTLDRLKNHAWLK